MSVGHLCCNFRLNCHFKRSNICVQKLSSMLLSPFERAKLLCWKSRDLCRRASGDWWADGVFLHLPGRNVADAPSRYLRGARRQWSHWLRQHLQTDGGAGEGEREGESVLAQARCHPMTGSVPGTSSPDRQEGMQVSVPRVNTTCAGTTANADLFSQPLHRFPPTPTYIRNPLRGNTQWN